ncbi:MAG TPA: carboxypeptidase-like regulatory domain-containing protein [Flavobacterium sp.]|nr:carboxypeptidase-like regulatory domain-containing protein [Flavobacterium sp.]
MKNLLYISFLLLGVLSFGQETLFSGKITVNERIVTGNVISKEDGLPIIGVAVIIENINKGTQTDWDGNYSIAANVNDTLVFSYVGMKTQKIRADKDTINVQMESDGIILDVEFGPPIIPRPKNPEVILLSKKEIRKLKREIRKKPRAKK